MTVVAALAGMTALAGVVLMVAAWRPRPVSPRRESGPSLAQSRAGRFAGAGLGAGALAWLITGWPPALLMGLVAGVLAERSTRPSQVTSPARLEAVAEWVRGLAGTLQVGVGLEQALQQSAAPPELAGEITRLRGRLASNWTTKDALRALGEDLADPTGDMVCGTLIMASERRGRDLAVVLKGAADAASAEVRMRRRVDADRAKPRRVTRLVTLITILTVTIMVLFIPYAEPYRTPLGQVALVGLVAGYAAVLVWMRKITAGKPRPRLMGSKARVEVGA